MINICIRAVCARHMATSSDQKREGVFVRVFATAMCKIADCSIVSVRCRRKDGKCSAEGVTRRNRSTGPKLRDQLLQAEVQVPSQQCLVCLVEHTDCEKFTKCRIQQCELSNVFSAPFVALRDANAHLFMFGLQARQRGSLSASTGCGWRTGRMSFRHERACRQSASLKSRRTISSFPVYSRTQSMHTSSSVAEMSSK